MKYFIKAIKILFALLATIVYIFVIVICGKQALNYFYHNHVQAAYDEKDYSINENLLKTANYVESYIVYYNNANIAYQNKQFDEAIENYDMALTYDVPEKKRCNIYINKSLTVIATLPDDYEEYENIDDSIEILEDARDVLFEDGCASKKGKGHSKEAEKLRQEIDDEIERLESMKDAAEARMEDGEKEQREKMKNMSKQEKKELQKFEGDKKEELEKNAEEAEKDRFEDYEYFKEMSTDWFEIDYNGIW